MNKLHAIITKEFKLLFRSKSSTLAVLLGPLLLVLMVGLVFTNAADQELVIGVAAEEFAASEEYVASLEAAFSVVHYDEDCQNDVRRGVIVSCVVLKASDPPQATIYVDPSNVNVVYAVIDQVTGQLEAQVGTLREGFAQDLLGTIARTRAHLLDEQERLSTAEVLLSQQQHRVEELAQEMRGIRVDVETVSTGDLDRAEEDAITLRDEYRELAEEMLADYQRDRDDTNASRDRVEDYELALEQLQDRADDSAAEDVFVRIRNSMQGIQDQAQRSESSAQAISEQTSTAAQSMEQPLVDVKQTVASLGRLGEHLGGLNITQTDLTRPLEPVIEPVTSEEDDFAFMLPHFIMLIVMFTALLLASTSIVREKNSSAYFRNFTTPTPEWTFVLATYLTTVLVVAAQLAIISLVALFFVSFNVFSAATLLTLLLAITFFALLGMLIGYSFKSYQGVMLASIALSALLLFISDLVLPVSTIPGGLQTLIQANPLVLSAGLLNLSIVFGFGVGDLLAGLGALVMYSVVMFVLIMIVQRLARIQFFEVASAHEHINRFLGQQEIAEGKELAVGDWRVVSKEQLTHVLSLMSDEEYETYASHKHNVFADWVLDVYKDEKLSKKLLNKSRKGAIEVLQKKL